jgi:pilus assembly protein CpaE
VTIFCESDQSTAGALTPRLGGDVRIVTSLPDAVDTLCADPTEKLIVIGGTVPLEEVLAFADEVRTERPDVALVLLRDEPATDVVARAVAAGIREVVRTGDDLRLAEACDRANPAPADPDAAAPQSRVPGKVVTVFSPKGGTGKTVIATNLAVALNAAGAHRVCLLDLDLEFGDVAISLSLAPVHSLIDAVYQDLSAPVDDRIDALITAWLPDLDCVLAPVNPGDATQISPAIVADIIQHLRRRYDYIVIDTPAHFSEHVLEALDAAEHHVLITTPEIPALKNLRLTLDMLSMLSYRTDSRTIVLNRTDPRAGLSTADAESAISTPISALIPASPDVSASINAGVPITLSEPNHPVSLAIRELADRAITGTPAATTADQRSSRFGLKRRMRST